MYNTDFVLSQSKLKSFEDPNVCLEEFRRRYIIKDLLHEPSLQMMYGSYFEFLAIGYGSGKQDDVKELPKKKNGDPYVAEERIKHQALRFKNMLDFFNEEFLFLEIIDIQKYLFHNKEDGVLDIVSKDVMSDRTVIADLKMTSDVNATYHPAMFGHNENIDITQAVHYADLWNRIYGELPLFSYLVFDYTNNKNFKRIDVDVSNEDILKLNERKNELRLFIQSHDPNVSWEQYCLCSKCTCLK